MPGHKIKIPVEIRHKNGYVTSCFALTDPDTGLHEWLNGSDLFFPVQTYFGETVFFAKSDISAFRPEPNRDEDEKNNILSLDPYKILDVTEESDDTEIREKYFALLQKIHPDTVDIEKNHKIFRIFATEVTRKVIGAFEYINGERKNRNRKD